MSTEALASGGKVWSFDKTDKTISAKVSKMSPAALWAIDIFLIIAITTGTFLINRSATHYEVIHPETLNGGYAAKVREANTVWLMLPVVFLQVFLIFYNGWTLVQVKKSGVVLWSAIVAALVFTTSSIGMFHPFESKPKPFEDWAKNTYGYTAIEQQKDADGLVYDAVNSEGNHVKVKGYDDNGALFLYENSSQLKSILDSVVERAIAKEEANK